MYFSNQQTPITFFYWSILFSVLFHKRFLGLFEEKVCVSSYHKQFHVLLQKIKKLQDHSFLCRNKWTGRRTEPDMTLHDWAGLGTLCSLMPGKVGSQRMWQWWSNLWESIITTVGRISGGLTVCTNNRHHSVEEMTSPQPSVFFF